MSGASASSCLPAVDVVIVNYRTGPLVVSCLESLERERETVPLLRAVVVDNASGDGSADLIDTAIRERGWDWVVLIRSATNGGFGAGNNQGIAWSLAQPVPAGFVWLLNPDTRVVPGAARALATFMAVTPTAGIAGTALLEGDGTPWPFAFRFPSVLGEVERAARWSVASRLLARQATIRRMGPGAQRADWVSGASVALRRELLLDGLRFDDGYFLYYEETDLCLQAAKRGWECWYVPQAVVLHIAGQSTGVTAKDAASLRRLPPYWFDSRQRYFRKNHGRLYAILADAGWLCGHLLFLAGRMLRRVPSADPPRLLSDFLRHSAFVPRWR